MCRRQKITGSVDFVMGPPGFEHPCKSPFSRARGCTGGGTPYARTVAFDASERVRARLAEAYRA